MQRALVVAVAAWAACLAGATAAAEALPDGGGTDRPPSRPEHRGPSPLRADPMPLVGSPDCPADADRVFRVGGVALRVEPGADWVGSPVEHGPPQRVTDHRRCASDRIARMQWLQVRSGRLPGLSATISLTQQEDSTTRSGEDALLLGQLSPVRTQRGHEFFAAPAGLPPFHGHAVYRLPRKGDDAAALGPLLIRCDNAAWPDWTPATVSRRPHQCTGWFQMLGLPPGQGVVVRYRFLRDSFDEPDWEALDLRVRERIAERTARERAR